MKYHTAIPIGRGGMGEVARAWDPTLNRPVALKFLRTDDPELEERMLREARAQARVSHPNICPVYEVGRHEGRVFIAMQFIDGVPLDRAAEDLGPEQKVALVKTVAEAVHAAHMAGLVHRDLKPANILVERTAEGDLKPWVVDFGIARERDVPGATVTGQVLGTPGYLSPEQARGEVSTIDRRSDVFSLGVVLYELLAGRRPFQGEGDSSMRELVGLLEGEPAPLRRWAPHVPRDLATVVMTCLEYERDRRYESARAMAEDLGRFLAGEPIQARPTGVIRRLTVRARRHPAVAGLLAVAVLAVAVLAVSLAVFWVKYTVDLRTERDLAEQARLEAERREQEATKVTDSLVGLFELADPASAPGEAFTAGQLLAEGEKRLERELADEPLRLARLLDVMAKSSLGLGVRHEAERLAQRALALRLEAAGEDSLEAADSLVTLAMALRRENANEAEESFRRAMEIRSRRLGADDPSVAKLRVRVAEVLLEGGNVDEADELAQQALGSLRRSGMLDSSGALMALNLAGRIRLRREDYKSAIADFNENLDRLRDRSGPDDPGLAPVLNNLAFAHRQAGDVAAAEQRYREALALVERVYGRVHPDYLRVVLNLAAVVDQQERHDETRVLLEEAVELRRELEPPGHWRLGRALTGSLGRFLMSRGEWSAAEAPVREGLAIFEAALEPTHAWVALARGQLAACLYGLGRVEEADSLLAASLGVLEQVEHLPEPNRVWAEYLADHLELAGRRGLAQRYRAILEKFNSGQGGAAPPGT